MVKKSRFLPPKESEKRWIEKLSIKKKKPKERKKLGNPFKFLFPFLTCWDWKGYENPPEQAHTIEHPNDTNLFDEVRKQKIVEII